MTSPNIIVFLADDLGFGDVGSHGNGVVQTPHLDASVAAESTNYVTGGLMSGVTYVFGMRSYDGVSTSAWTYTQLTVAEGFVQSSTGACLIVIEAENYHSTTNNGSADTWTNTTAFAGYSGTSAMQAGPDDASVYTGNSGPALDFDVFFSQEGTNYLWVRCREPDNGNVGDSLHAGIDGALPASATLIEQQENGTGIGTTWVWAARLRDGSRIYLDVPSSGPHTVNVWPREDGIIVDKILLTTDEAYVPTGLEPESEVFVAPVLDSTQTWRVVHFGFAGDTGDAADDADPDSDGMSNGQEFIAGTRPTSGNSVFKIDSLSLTNTTDAAISLVTVAGREYQVEVKPALTNETWQVLQSWTNSGVGTLRVIDGEDLRSRFYRIRVKQVPSL